MEPKSRGRSIPKMGWDTNNDIGGVPDWQNVGEETGSRDPYPGGHGPVGRMLDREPRRGGYVGPHITKPPIDAKSTGGVMEKPKHSGSLLHASGSYETNPKYLNTTASEENKSAKFKNPNVKSRITPVQRQYED